MADLKMTGVSKSYGPVEVLKDINLEIKPESWWYL